jgi:hypothetical protein
MIYGGVKFDQKTNEDGACRDVAQVDYNTAHNCTTVSIPSFERYDLTAYTLYRLTFGESLDEVCFYFNYFTSF